MNDNDIVKDFLTGNYTNEMLSEKYKHRCGKISEIISLWLKTHNSHDIVLMNEGKFKNMEQPKELELYNDNKQLSRTENEIIEYYNNWNKKH